LRKWPLIFGGVYGGAVVGGEWTIFVDGTTFLHRLCHCFVGVLDLDLQQVDLVLHITHARLCWLAADHSA
jgi:hypothetical protein